jgi:hypothetical protein
VALLLLVDVVLTAVVLLLPLALTPTLPTQASGTGQGNTDIVPSSARQKPTSILSEATVVPGTEQSIPVREHALHNRSASFARNFSAPQIHSVSPMRAVVSSISHFVHSTLPSFGAISPFLHGRHSLYPSSLYFPGGHSPEHCAVVAPVVLLNVPPRHSLHWRIVFASTDGDQRPSGQDSHVLARPSTAEK